MAKALMLIDVQKWGFTGDWQVADSEALLTRIRNRVDLERAKPENLIIHVQNDAPEGELDAPGGEFWPLMIDPIGDEWLVNKTTADTFETNPDLADRLRGAGVDEIEMIGVQSENCVRATVITARVFRLSKSQPIRGGTLSKTTKLWQPSKISTNQFRAPS